jgi:predicted DNA-binding transcriptional regulator YafY
MKHSRDKIIARLSSTLGKLNAGESVSIPELAEEHSVSTKTIERDIDAIAVPSSPIPIIVGYSS